MNSDPGPPSPQDIAFLQSTLGVATTYITRAKADITLPYVNMLPPDVHMTDVIGRPVLDFVTPGFRDNALACMLGVLQTRVPASYIAPDLRGRVYETHVAPMVLEDGNVGLCTVALDISKFREREATLGANRAKLQLAISASGAGF
ncbi:MAG: hypothetical protein ACI9MC_001776 [Kiritimatiellia bacterium]